MVPQKYYMLGAASRYTTDPLSRAWKSKEVRWLNKVKDNRTSSKIVYEKKALVRGSANVSEVQPTSENGERTNLTTQIICLLQQMLLQLLLQMLC